MMEISLRLLFEIVLDSNKFTQDIIAVIDHVKIIVAFFGQEIRSQIIFANGFFYLQKILFPLENLFIEIHGVDEMRLEDFVEIREIVFIRLKKLFFLFFQQILLLSEHLFDFLGDSQFFINGLLMDFFREELVVNIVLALINP